MPRMRLQKLIPIPSKTLPTTQTTMPPSLLPQLRVLARSFHTTTQRLKGPRARPAASVRSKNKQPWSLGSKSQGSGLEQDISIPTDILLSAHKSKALPFGPFVATNIIRSYIPMTSMVPSEKIGNAICTEYKITPHDLTLLALTFLRSESSATSSPKRVALTRHLLATCSMLSDPTAVIQLHILLTKSPKNTFTITELQQAIGRLAKIAEDGHPGALFRMGEVLEGQDKDAKAEECYRRAGEKGISEAWVRLGRLQVKGGKNEEAKLSFEKGKAQDNPHAYYYLAMNSPPSPMHETYLLKAAASGVIEAAHNLGVHYQSTSPNPTLAKEWYTLAATEGFPPSQVNLATMLRDEGKLATACEWLTQAQLEKGEVGADARRLKREIEVEMGRE